MKSALASKIEATHAQCLHVLRDDRRPEVLREASIDLRSTVGSARPPESISE
jgi:hypothetical protein